MSKLLLILISIPKSIFFNIKVLGFKEGIKLPILIKYNTKIKQCKRDSIEVRNIKTAAIKIGINHGTYGVFEERNKSYIFIDDKSKIVFDGRADIKEGTSILSTYGGRIEFGDNFSCNRGCLLSSDQSILIGKNVVLGWNVHIRTSDGHNIFSKENTADIINKSKIVNIGNHCWLAANSTLLKGAGIPDNCIVGYNSCVTKKFTQKNCIIGGYPAKIIKENVDWKH